MCVWTSKMTRPPDSNMLLMHPGAVSGNCLIIACISKERSRALQCVKGRPSRNESTSSITSYYLDRSHHSPPPQLPPQTLLHLLGHQRGANHSGSITPALFLRVDKRQGSSLRKVIVDIREGEDRRAPLTHTVHHTSPHLDEGECETKVGLANN